MISVNIFLSSAFSLVLLLMSSSVLRLLEGVQSSVTLYSSSFSFFKQVFLLSVSFQIVSTAPLNLPLIQGVLG